MIVTPVYTSSGQKFYRYEDAKTKAKGPQLIPSASMLVASLTGETFERVPFETLLKAELEGTGAHSVACEAAMIRAKLIKRITLPAVPNEYPWTPEDWRTMCDQVLVDAERFYRVHNVKPIAIEQPSASSRYRFGGTPDLYAELTWQINGRDRRIKVVIDHKRVAQITSSHYLKLRSYRMLDGYKDAQLSLILWFQKSGGAKAIEVKPDPFDDAAIISEATRHNWQLARGILRAA